MNSNQMSEQETRRFWEELEKAFRELGNYTVFDIFKEAFPEEYSYHLIASNEEWAILYKRVERQLTLERKKTLLFAELDALEDYFENDEFRNTFEDFGETTIDKLIDKVKDIFPKFQKTSRWMELKHDEKLGFLAIRNLPSDLLGEDLNPKSVYKKFLLHPNLQKPLTELNSPKLRKSTLKAKFLNFAKNIFNDHFQIELNQKLQDELKKLLPESEYQTFNSKDKDTSLELTQSQWVLVYYYFFKQNGLEPRVNIDISPLARFIHLTTGIKFTTIQKSEVYDKLSKAPNFKVDKELLKDLEKIRPIFEMHGFNDVLQTIDNEIDMCKKKR